MRSWEFFILIMCFSAWLRADDFTEAYQSGRYVIKKSNSNEPANYSNQSAKEKTTSVDSSSRSTKVGKAAPQLYIHKHIQSKLPQDKKRNPASANDKEGPLEDFSIKLKPGTESEPELKPEPKPKHEPKLNEPAPATEPKLSQQIGEIFQSHQENIFEFYKNQLDPDDIRNNHFDFDVISGFNYINSESKYSYRKYTSNYNSLAVRPTIWLTPLVGIKLLYRFSLDGNIESYSGTYRSAVKFEQTRFGVVFKSFLNLSKVSPSLEYGFSYFEDKLLVPSDDAYRNKIRSSGLGISLVAKFPTSESYLWEAGANLYPRIQHREEETAISIRSGNNSNNVRFDLYLGGVYKMNRQNQILFGVELDTEKNYFDGNSNFVDQTTGQYQTNVSVTQTTMQILLGYRWGR